VGGGFNPLFVEAAILRGNLVAPIIRPGERFNPLFVEAAILSGQVSLATKGGQPVSFNPLFVEAAILRYRLPSRCCIPGEGFNPLFVEAAILSYQ